MLNEHQKCSDLAIESCLSLSLSLFIVPFYQLRTIIFSDSILNASVVMNLLVSLILHFDYRVIASVSYLLANNALLFGTKHCLVSRIEHDLFGNVFEFKL